MIVLQSRLSGMFFKDFGYWVASVAEAVPFESRERAWKFIHEQRVTDVALHEIAEPRAPEQKLMQPAGAGA